MIQLPDILFPNKPLTVKALAYISETALIFHFAKDSIWLTEKDMILDG